MSYDLYAIRLGSSDKSPALHLYKQLGQTWHRIATFRGAALDALWGEWEHRYCLPKLPEGTPGQDQLRLIRIGERLQSKICTREGIRLEAFAYVAKGRRNRKRLAEAAHHLSLADTDLLQVEFLRRIEGGGETGERALRALRILVGAAK